MSRERNEWGVSDDIADAANFDLIELIASSAAVNRSSSLKDVRDFRKEQLPVVLQRDDRTSHASQKVIGTHGFFVFERRALKVTDHNFNFEKKFGENRQKIPALIARSDEAADRNDFDAALQIIDEAYRIDSEHLVVLSKYGLLLSQEEKYVEAIFFLKKVFRGCNALDPQNECSQMALNNLQDVRVKVSEKINGFITVKNYHEALDFVRKALKADDDYGMFHFFEASILCYMMKDDEAMGVIKKILADQRLADIHPITKELAESVIKKTPSSVVNSNFTTSTKPGAGK